MHNQFDGKSTFIKVKFDPITNQDGTLVFCFLISVWSPLSIHTAKLTEFWDGTGADEKR